MSGRASTWSWVLVITLLFGCGPRGPEKIADRFVDLYFVEIDQKRALELSAGLARSKIEEELSLVEAIRRGYPPDRAKPSIFYVRRQAATVGDHARFSYDLTIRQGRDETHRHALISLERSGASWQVANFLVEEGYLPQPPSPR